MASVRIEMDRGLGWELRGEGEADADADRLATEVAAYAIQYPHRAFLDGRLIATAERPFGRRGKMRLVRHDG